MLQKNPKGAMEAEIRAVLDLQDDRRRFGAGFLHLVELSGGAIRSPGFTTRLLKESSEEKRKREDEEHLNKIAALEAYLAIITADKVDAD